MNDWDLVIVIASTYAVGIATGLFITWLITRYDVKHPRDDT